MFTPTPDSLSSKRGSPEPAGEDPHTNATLPSAHQLRLTSFALSAVVMLIGTLVIVGWALNIPVLKSVLPSLVTMKVNTALGLILLAIALAGLSMDGAAWRFIVWSCLATVLIFSILTLAEYVFGVNLRIDNLIFYDHETARFPGRNAPATNIAFLGLVTSFVLLHIRRAPLVAQGILFVVISAPLATLGGYLYRAPGMYSHAKYPVIALHTSLALMFLCIGGLFTRPKIAMMRVVTSDTLAGSLARKLLPAAMGIPLLAGLLVLAGEQAGLYTPAFGSALLVSFCGLFFTGVVCWTVTLLWKTEASRRGVEQIRLQTERKLGEGEQRLGIALETAGLGLWQLDMVSGALDCSAQTKAHFGLSPDVVVTRELLIKLVHPEDRNRTVETRDKAFSESRDYQSEYRVIWSDGSLHWIVSSGRGIDVDGDAPRMVGVTLDITSKKNADIDRERSLESEREARSEAERANRMKDEFLSVVSHELRTPLNAILGWSQLLRPTSSAEDLTEGLATIERNARAQVRIIEDILDMGRIISGNIRLDAHPLDLRLVIQAALDSVRLAADAKKITLHPLFHPQNVAMVGDAVRVQQIIWNLLINAIKFTPSGGNVQVSTRPVDGQVEITLSDNGEGIKPEFLPHVFDRFRQGDGSTTRRHGGLGLGLAIVKQLTELHGGTVTADSAGVGRGSTFCVSLPTMSLDTATSHFDRGFPSIAKASLAGNKPLGLSGLRVLVVDDEIDLRTLVKRILEGAAASIVLAGSVDEAMQHLNDGHRFDLIISDIGMPNRDGYDLIQAVRSLPAERGGTIPVIALTAFARAEDHTRAIAAGFNLHVAKPVNPAELCAVVAKLMRRAG